VEGHRTLLHEQLRYRPKFDRDDKGQPVTDLRKAMAVDPNMAVTIVNGWNDLGLSIFRLRAWSCATA